MKHDRHSPVRARFRSASALAAILLAVAGSGSASLASGNQDKASRRAQELREIRSAVSRGQLVPLPRIIAIAEGKAKGDLLKVALEKKGELLVYEVKILAPSGQVREVKINARSGAVLSVEDD